MKQWFAVDVTVQPAAIEAVESAFNAMGSMGSATGFQKHDAGGPIVVTGFFEQPISLEDVEDAVADEFDRLHLNQDDVHSIEFRNVPEEDWLAEWKKHWRPTEAGKFIVAPPWSGGPPTPDKIMIRILF